MTKILATTKLILLLVVFVLFVWFLVLPRHQASASNIRDEFTKTIIGDGKAVDQKSINNLSKCMLGCINIDQDIQTQCENDCKIKNPQTPKTNGIPLTNFSTAVGTIIKIILGLLGVLFLILMIWGGSIWMFSSGDSSKIGQAKQIIIWSVFGIAIILSAYTITLFVLGGFGLK